jgi:hypothetical protein
MLPLARDEDLVVEMVGDETLVYDCRTHRAHCLNRTASLVWLACDGRTGIPEIAAQLDGTVDAPLGAEAVWLALRQLQKAGLLRERVTPPAEAILLSRREVARKLARVGALAVLVPAVTSILAPTPAQAATCRLAGQPCSTSVECCSNLCNVTVCA